MENIKGWRFKRVQRRKKLRETIRQSTFYIQIVYKFGLCKLIWKRFERLDFCNGVECFSDQDVCKEFQTENQLETNSSFI